MSSYERFDRFCSVNRDGGEKCRGCAYLNDNRRLSFEVIIIPRPENISLVVLSEYPTEMFIEPYRTGKDMGPQERLVYLFESAMIRPLINELRTFAKKNGLYDEEKVDRLEQLVMGETYWTHMRKCFLPSEIKDIKTCADRWLLEELDRLFDGDCIRPKAIIALGINARDWLKEHGYDDVIYFPMPAGRWTRKWWDDEKKKGVIGDGINRLHKL